MLESIQYFIVHFFLITSLFIFFNFAICLVDSEDYAGDLKSLANLIDEMMDYAYPEFLYMSMTPFATDEYAYNRRHPNNLNFANFMANLRKMINK